MEKTVNIIGIKLKKGGLKGLEINYLAEHQDKDGKKWNKEIWEDQKMPVGEELDRVIKAFRFHLAAIMGYELENLNDADFSVTEICFPGIDTRIIGSVKVLNGIHAVKLDTQMIGDEHEYEKMDELRGLVRQLKEKVADYREGKIVMSNEQLVMQFYKSKGKFDEVEFAAMTEDEKVAKATEILEKYGSIVIHQSDMGGVPVGEDGPPVKDQVSPVYPGDNTIVNLCEAPAEEVAPNFGEAPAPKVNYSERVAALSQPKEDAVVITPNFQGSPSPAPIAQEAAMPMFDEEEETLMITAVGGGK